MLYKFENLSENEIKILPIIVYKNTYSYTDEEMAKRCKLTVERYLELLSNPSLVTVEELFNISLAIETNVLTLLENLLLEKIKYSSNLNNGEEYLNSLVNAGNTKELVKLISNNSLIYDQGYQIMNLNIPEQINATLAKSICELLIENNELKSALKLMGPENLLGIKSLKELNKYSNLAKDALIYGIDTRLKGKCINLPKYYFSVLNSLPYEEQQLVLEETLNRPNRIIGFETYDFDNVTIKSRLLEKIKTYQNNI